MRHLKQNILTAWLVLALTLCSSLLAEVASVQISPRQISQDDTAYLTIEIKNSESVPVVYLPEVEGLSFGDMQRGQQSIQIFNGKRSSSISYLIPISAAEPGTYTLPAWKLELDGKPYDLTPQRLVVTKGNFFVRVQQPEPFYVGQTATAKVELYIRGEFVQKIGDMGTPAMNSDAFLMSNMAEQFEQRQEMVDGEAYLIVSWDHTRTALKSGPQTIDYTMVFGVKSERNSRFNDSFFGNSLFDRFNQQRREVPSGPLKINVTPLPEPQPEGFTGAVGKFNVAAHLTAEERTVGEPFSLVVEVSGEGNFDRIEPPAFPEVDGIRAYEPKSDMQAADPTGRSGVKTFDYLLDPLSDSITATPPMVFSFFDPKTTEYIAMEIPSLPIKINPAPENTRFYQPVTQSGEELALKPIIRQPALVDIKKLPGVWKPGVAPGFKNPVVLITTQGIPALALACLFFIRKSQRRLTEDQGYARLRKASKETREALAQARAAVGSKDAEAFYAAAERGLKHSLSRLSDSPVESLVAAEVRSILQGHAVDESLINDAVQFFEEAEQVKFAGGALAGDLSARCTALEKLIPSLEGLRK